MLKVSVKTLQRYRKKGILPYLTLDGKYFTVKATYTS